MLEASDFERCRPLLFSIAYRMLGSAAEAEDVVQDTWLRAAAAQASEVRSPKAYLTTIATRLALDRLKSARVAREHYVDGRLDSVYVCSVSDQAIAGIRVVRNPDKLGYIQRQLAAIGPAPRHPAPPEA